MANYNSPRYERVFIQNQGSTQASILAASTLSAAKLLRSVPNGVSLNPVMPITPVPWKTGTRSTQPGISGRQSASWSLNNLPVIPSGTAGTAPDMDALMAGIFQNAGVVVASTSVTYGFSDAGLQPFTLASFPHSSSTLTSRLVYGCTVEQAVWELNGNVFQMNASGTGVYRLDSDNFSNEGTAQKGGLGAFPTEPSSPTTNGVIIPGFGGTAVIGSNVELQLRTCRITVKTGARLVGDLFGSALPQFAVGGERMVSIELGFVDNDSAALIALKNLAKQYGTEATTTITVGTVSGSQVVFTMKAIQFISPSMQDQSDFVETSFPSSAAHASAIGNVDDLTVAFQ